MRHVDALTEAGQELRAAPRIARKLDSLTRGIPFNWDMEDRVQFSQEQLIRAGDLMGEIGTCELWKRNGRVCYDLNTDLADALYRSNMGKVPGELFDRLPHINPMIVLPDPWPVGTGRGGFAEGYVRCFFLVGWVGSALCSTNDPQREGIAILFCYDQVDEETGEMGIGSVRDFMPLPTSRKSFTAEEAIAFVEEWQGGYADEADRKGALKTYRPLLQKAFSVLTYLCTDNRDVEEAPEWTRKPGRKKTGKGRKARDRDPFWVRVGWYIGPALHEAKVRAANNKRLTHASTPSGIEYGPQHRAGHFKTVWFGPGKKKSTTQWIEPYWTKLEELPEDVDPPTQIVPVNPQHHDPFRRRNTIGK
jgi:hypothetical protein